MNDFIEENKVENFDLLKKALVENINLIRYVYSTYFPKVHNRTNTFGVRNKSVFGFVYQPWRNDKIKPGVVGSEEKKV